jgi:FixJ family two-component response regulator
MLLPRLRGASSVPISLDTERMPRLKNVIAIVEDDAAMLKSIERLLGAHDYATSPFTNAEDFLNSPIRHRTAALILDIQLPGMSGLELARHLLDAGSTIPIVFITGDEKEATRREALALGCIDYLQKPFELKQLIRALEPGRRW